MKEYLKKKMQLHTLNYSPPQGVGKGAFYPQILVRSQKVMDEGCFKKDHGLEVLRPLEPVKYFTGSTLRLKATSPTN